MPKVMLFSTSTCSWCRRAKRYFKEHRGPFKEVSRLFQLLRGGSGWFCRVAG